MSEIGIENVNTNNPRQDMQDKQDVSYLVDPVILSGLAFLPYKIDHDQSIS